MNGERTFTYTCGTSRVKTKVRVGRCVWPYPGQEQCWVMTQLWLTECRESQSSSWVYRSEGSVLLAYHTAGFGGTLSRGRIRLGFLESRWS